MREQRQTNHVSSSTQASVWILMIPQKFYPTHHAMLETVYSRLLPVYGYKITWLMLSGDVKKLTYTEWNDTEVVLFPTKTGRGL